MKSIGFVCHWIERIGVWVSLVQLYIAIPFIYLPAIWIRRLRIVAWRVLDVSVVIWGTCSWVWSCQMIYHAWGWLGLFLGLFFSLALLRVGPAPLALLMLLLHRDWFDVGILLGLVGLIYGGKAISGMFLVAIVKSTSQDISG